MGAGILSDGHAPLHTHSLFPSPPSLLGAGALTPARHSPPSSPVAQVLLSKADDQLADSRRASYDASPSRLRSLATAPSGLSARTAPVADGRLPFLQWLDKCWPQFVRGV